MANTETNNSLTLFKNAQKKFGGNLSFSAREAYNLLKTNLSFSIDKEGKQVKVIGITSPCPQEGKSYTAINLAYAFANEGKKTLLIDADMRRPSVAKSLGLSKTHGLSNVLVKTENAEDDIHKGVLHKKLDLLLSGSVPPSPNTLVASNEMKELLENQSKNYDYILLDLPPVNSVSDALTASKYLDGIVLVIKHNYSRKKDLSEALRQLKFVNANILGIVYNDYSSGSSHYYKNYQKYSSYYYYRSKYDYASNDIKISEEKKEEKKDEN